MDIIYTTLTACIKQLRQCVHCEQLYDHCKCGYVLDNIPLPASLEHTIAARGGSNLGIQWDLYMHPYIHADASKIHHQMKNMVPKIGTKFKPKTGGQKALYLQSKTCLSVLHVKLIEMRQETTQKTQYNLRGPKHSHRRVPAEAQSNPGKPQESPGGAQERPRRAQRGRW